MRALQNTIFIGDLGPGDSAQAVFDVIPSQATNLTFTTTYREGINVHSTITTVPILIDNGRRSADLVVNDITLTPKGGSYEVDGDVTNGGVDQALAVVVSVSSPAQPVDPYPSYVIGTLSVDDFSSFSVTFSGGPALTSVPLLVTWKDSDGNSYSNTVDVNLRTASVSGGTGSQSRVVTGGGGGGPLGFFGGGGGRGGLQVPVIPIIAIIVIAVALLVAWRKGVFDRFTKKGKGKQGNQQNRG